MAEIGYHGSYERFETEDRTMAAGFLGADNIIGDRFSIESSYEDGKRTGWLVNPFGVRMGTVSDATLDTVELLKAKGWTTTALLVFVAFDEDPAPGLYWGEVALIGYDPRNESAFSNWIATLQKNFGNGIRPDLDLGAKGLASVIESNGSWIPSGRHPLPEKKKGRALVKSERSFNERLVDQARKGNKGCMVGSWAFLLALVAALIFGLHSCGLF